MWITLLGPPHKPQIIFVSLPVIQCHDAFNSTPPSLVHTLCCVTLQSLSLKMQALFHQSVNPDWPCGLLWPTECRPDIVPVLSLGLRRPPVFLLANLHPCHCYENTPRPASWREWDSWSRDESSWSPCQSQSRPARPQTFEKPAKATRTAQGTTNWLQMYLQ